MLLSIPVCANCGAGGDFYGYDAAEEKVEGTCHDRLLGEHAGNGASEVVGQGADDGIAGEEATEDAN